MWKLKSDTEVTEFGAGFGGMTNYLSERGFRGNSYTLTDMSNGHELAYSRYKTKYSKGIRNVYITKYCDDVLGKRLNGVIFSDMSVDSSYGQANFSIYKYYEHFVRSKPVAMILKMTRLDCEETQIMLDRIFSVYENCTLLKPESSNPLNREFYVACIDVRQEEVEVTVSLDVIQHFLSQVHSQAIRCLRFMEEGKNGIYFVQKKVFVDSCEKITRE